MLEIHRKQYVAMLEQRDHSGDLCVDEKIILKSLQKNRLEERKLDRDHDNEFPGSIKGPKFLTSRVAISFLIRILLYGVSNHAMRAIS